jgi:hypothetical protein
MAGRHRVLCVTLAAVLGAATASQAALLARAPGTAIDSAAAATTTELRGADIFGHPVGQLALCYAELVHAGRMDEALALSTEGEREKARTQSPVQRQRRERFRRKVVPSPVLFSSAIEHGGVLSIHGETAFLEVVLTESRREEPDGSVTSSSTTLALPFVLENGAWRVAG